MSTTGSWYLREYAVAVASAVAVALFISCGGGEAPSGPGPTETPIVTSIAVTPGTDTLWTLGRTRTFTAQARDASGNAMSGVTILWKSTNPAVATVDISTGIVTAVGNGTASIQAMAGTVSGQASIAVSQAVAGITVSPPSMALFTIGTTQAFTAVAKDSGGAPVTGVRFLWLSSNPGVATVDTLGVATAQAPGVITVSATGRGIPGYAGLSIMQAATHLAFSVQPTNVFAGSAISPAVQVEIRDAAGALVTNSRQPITLSLGTNPATGTLTGTATVYAVGGVATFSGLWLDKAGSGYTLDASSAGLTGTTSTGFGVAAGPATRLYFSNQPPTTIEANELMFPLRVAFEDAFGNLTTGADLDRVTLHTQPWPDAVVRYSDITTPSAAFRQIEGAKVDRPGAGYSIEVRSGNLTAISNPFSARVTFHSISSGSGYACGLGATATYCWGGNSFARLGIGFAGDRDTVPAPVLGGHTFIQVRAGGIFTCGLEAGGAAFCWGLNWNVFPQQVPGSGAGALVFTDISVGDVHACGLTAAHSVYCWGENVLGQLGDSTTTTPSGNDPVYVSGSGTGQRLFTSISAGVRHTCAATTTEAAYCWGANDLGQLGDSSTTNSVVPVQVAGSGTGIRRFTNISAGRNHTCGFKAGSVAFCWGYNGAGQLGGGIQVPPLIQGEVPTQVGVNGFGSSFSDITATNDNSCGVTNSAIVCWGSNAFGQIGNGFSGNQSTAVGANLTFLASAVSIGGTSACGLTIDGVYCWGSNQYGQLGIGTLAVGASGVPVKIVQ